jgi:hypothetical protein
MLGGPGEEVSEIVQRKVHGILRHPRIASPLRFETLEHVRYGFPSKVVGVRRGKSPRVSLNLMQSLFLTS